MGERPRVSRRPDMLGMLWILGLTLLGAVGCSDPEALSGSQGSAPSAEVLPQPGAGSALVSERGGFVGVSRCAECHAAEAEAWRGSHHDRSMEVPTPASVVGRFDGRSLQDFGRTWRFVQEAEQFVVELTEPDGTLERLVIDSTFGFHPLQQYLVDRGDGYRQALPVAWDGRSKVEGGERWFSLHPEESIDRDDPLHWEQAAYNWNSQCASCHSTRVSKGFDSETNRFDTRSVELDVGCEACHGPGLQHVARQIGGEGAPAASSDGGPGFSVHYEAWDAGLWRRETGQRIASRAVSRQLDAQPEVCAPCHSRRSEIVASPAIGDAFLDGYSPQLLEAGLYFDDGQIRDEVYVWGSFEQSRMFQAGVRCSDCHEPHSLGLRKEGNALCSSCHAPDVFDASTHRGHSGASGGTECVDCHMPERIYMQVDGRRDHSFSLPRPLRSSALGAPDACRTCHPAQTPEWAAEATREWLGSRQPAERWPDYLVRDGVRLEGAERWLEIATDPAHPPIVRGSAWVRYSDEASGVPPFEVLRAHFEQAEDLERLGLIRLARRLDPDFRAALLRPLLDAERRAVRIAAAEALADTPANRWRPADGAALARGLREYRAAQEANQERVEVQVNLGMLAMRQGDLAGARKAYGKAIERAPYFVPAHVNLAELERLEGNESASVAELRAALSLEPGAVWVRYALGLALYRAGDPAAALRELERAAWEGPGEPRLILGWALALDAMGERRSAIHALAEAVDSDGANGEVRQALVTLLRDAGDTEEALARAREWSRAEPTEIRARALVEELERPGSPRQP